MPKRCTICTSSDRQAIEEAVRAGEPYRVTALENRVSYSALQRHVAAHMAAEDTVQEAVKAQIEDVINLPVDMAQRRDLVQELIYRCAEPLMDEGGTLDKVQVAALIKLFKVQQADEITVLRVSGLLRDGSGRSKTAQEFPVMQTAEDYERVMERVDAAFQKVVEDYRAAR